MNFNIRNRFLILGVLLVGLFTVLFVQLIKLTVVQGSTFAAAASKLKVETITVSGARGSILDRNGLPLAYDQKSYNVQFYRDPTKTSTADKAYYTDVITKTIKIIEDNGGKTIDTFAIKYDGEKGEYIFDWGVTEEQAQKDREANWRSNMYIDVKNQNLKTPEQLYLYLRDRYQIPSELDYDEARKILSIWQEVQLASWTAYNPVVIAYGVSTQTVAEIKTLSNELSGMGIAESTMRIYPRGALAANVLGYVGRISATAEQLKAFINKGYKSDDLMGVQGIEKSMEDYLTGNTTERQGIEIVEVDKYKVVQNVLSTTQPKRGDNVMLTIDVTLQQAVEQSLSKNVPNISQKEIEHFEANINSREYKELDINDIKLAKSGAAVVIDVNTGEVLAMANYPSYDPNLFIRGMTEAEYEAYGFKDAETAPLFNKAISSKDTPGSIFKMVTGLAGLMEGEKDPEKGITLETKISDEGEYKKILRPGASKGPRCWTTNISNHKDQDIIAGLAHSCDYFFYEVARRLGIDLLDKWGRQFGLTSSTGIELPGESIGYIGNQKILYDPAKLLKDQVTYIPSLVKYQKTFGLITLLKSIAAQRKVNYEEAVYEKTADDLIAIAGISWKTDESGGSNTLRDEKGQTMGDHVRRILSKNMNIRTQVSKNNYWGEEISQYIASNLIWTPYMTITTGMGQGVVQVTPIALARYVAAVANGGTVYETHIVKKITDQSGQTVYEQKPVVFNTLDAPKEYLDALKKGMANVVSAEDGTAASYFGDFEYQDDIAGKTGTAQVSNTDLENNSWFVCFAPFKEGDDSVKPEIAIVVYIPHGFKGGYATYVVKDIVQFYMDRKQTIAQQNIPAADTLVN